jgi:hypothetical protein
MRDEIVKLLGDINIAIYDTRNEPRGCDLSVGVICECCFTYDVLLRSRRILEVR